MESEYKIWLIELTSKIRSAQIKAALAVNSSLIQLYWEIGKQIADKQALFEGRNNYVAQLSKDLQAEFPDIKGFSRTNLFYIRKFYQFYGMASVQQVVGMKEKSKNTEIELLQQLIAININSVQQPVAKLNTSNSGPLVQQPVGQLEEGVIQIPWGHNILIFSKSKNIIEA